MLSTDDTMNRLNQSKIADMFGFDGVYSIKSTASIGKRMSVRGLMTSAASDGDTDTDCSLLDYKSILTNEGLPCKSDRMRTKMSAHGLMTTAASDGGIDNHCSSSNYKSILTGGFQR